MNRFVLFAALFVPTLAACAPKNADPTAAETTAPPADPHAWRAQRPPAGFEVPYSAPTAATFNLSNGIPVYLVKQGDLPLVCVRLLVTTGRESNPKGKAGLASLTANMLDEGTKTRDSATIAIDASRLGAELSVSVGEETAVAAIDALTGAELGPSLDLLANVVLNPKFDKAAFARVQSEVLTGIQSAKSEPRDVVAREFLAQYWGADHPYGTPAVGSETSVKSIKVADVARQYTATWHAGNASLVIAGNIDAATIQPLLEARFGNWKGSAGARPEVAAPASLLKTRLVFVEQPGAVQSVIRVGGPGPRRSDPNYWPTEVAATLFGGMFSSRLNMNLREEHGWSYGAYAGLGISRDHAVFAARTSVQADKTAPAVAEILKEMRTQAGRSPTPDEMKLTVANLVKSLPGNFANNAATATTFLQIPAQGLAADAWATYPASINAVTADAAGFAGKTLLDADNTLIVVAGPRTVEVEDEKGGKVVIDVAAELKALGFEYVEAKR